MFEYATEFNGGTLCQGDEWRQVNLTAVNTVDMFIDSAYPEFTLANCSCADAAFVNMGEIQDCMAEICGDINACDDSFDFSDWNVSGVVDMSQMFKNKNTFNGDISAWNVSKVTNMM